MESIEPVLEHVPEVDDALGEVVEGLDVLVPLVELHPDLVEGDGHTHPHVARRLLLLDRLAVWTGHRLGLDRLGVIRDALILSQSSSG